MTKPYPPAKEQTPDEILDRTLRGLREDDLVEAAVRARTILGLSKRILACEFSNSSASDVLKVAEILVSQIPIVDHDDDETEPNEPSEDPEDPLAPQD